jgi:hypothetical protein
MTILTAKNPTLMDLIMAIDGDGAVAEVGEVLNQTNEILLDMTFQEANGLTGHQSSIRTGLPTPTWRKLYGGVQPTKGTTAKITDTIGNLEDYAEVDKDLADLNGNTTAFRMLEDRAHIEGMNQEMATTTFYGNEGLTPAKFTGLAPRFNAISGATNAQNIIDAAGTGTDNASIWLIGWSPMTCFGIFPKGSKAGLSVKDMGEVTLEAAPDGGGRMQAYRTHYKWQMGLVVKDWRFIVRICNIDRSDLKKDAATGADLNELMFLALNYIPNLSMVRPAFYMDRRVRTKLFQQTSAAVKGSTLTTENVGGTITTTFHGVPIRRCDMLQSDEARVV